MSVNFANTYLYCPSCPPEMVGKNRDRKSAATMLEVVARNYSGCSVDIAACPQCGRTFQVSYKVDEVIEVTGPRQPPEAP